MPVTGMPAETADRLRGAPLTYDAVGWTAGHPESGEEAFMIHQDDDGTVTFTITAFSRPATPLPRIIGPAGRALQDHITARYLRAMAS